MIAFVPSQQEILQVCARLYIVMLNHCDFYNCMLAGHSKLLEKHYEDVTELYLLCGNLQKLQKNIATDVISSSFYYANSRRCHS